MSRELTRLILAGGPTLTALTSAGGASFESFNHLTGGAPLLALFEKWPYSTSIP